MEQTVTMKNFWEKVSQTSGSPDTGPEKVAQLEEQEIMSLLPELVGKDVLELGAGCGRFTYHLKSQARSVVSVDFIQDFVTKNQKVNGCANLDYICQDVTQLDRQDNSYDVVFSNWLFMYLSDEDARALLTKILGWLRPGGYLFFRESCFHPSATENRSKENPCLYRLPATYVTLVESALSSNSDNSSVSSCYAIVLQRSIQAYVEHMNNNNQICWLLEKTDNAAGENQGFQTFQQFLDNRQYSSNSILKYEAIFGENFVSVGGLETTEDFVAMLDLQPGQKVLDVGAGIGGSAFYMADKFDVTVLAMDLSSNMISIGLEKANEFKDKRVQFEIADATKRYFAPGSFDVIYSRDTVLHIPNKRDLFKSFLDWLKPGGKLLISDYSCSDEEHSEQFKSYVKQRGYILLSVQNYSKLLSEVGFVNVRGEDRTDQFTKMLTKELVLAENIQEDFIKKFTLEGYNDIVKGWKAKLNRVAMGDQKWGLFYAEKP